VRYHGCVLFFLGSFFLLVVLTQFLIILNVSVFFNVGRLTMRWQLKVNHEETPSSSSLKLLKGCELNILNSDISII